MTNEQIHDLPEARRLRSKAIRYGAIRARGGAPDSGKVEKDAEHELYTAALDLARAMVEAS